MNSTPPTQSAQPYPPTTLGALFCEMVLIDVLLQLNQGIPVSQCQVRVTEAQARETLESMQRLGSNAHTEAQSVKPE